MTNPIKIINEVLLQRTWKEIDYRLDVLRPNNSTHVEIHKMRRNRCPSLTVLNAAKMWPV